MKVNIGPYLNWYGPYQIFALFQKLGFSEKTTDHWAEKSPEWFTNFCQWIYDKRKRKIKVKIDKYDTWSMDSTLAYIIIPMLEQLKATKHGTPVSMFEEKDGLDTFGNPSEEAYTKAMERWDTALSHMIWSFKQILEEDHDSFQIVGGKLDLNTYLEDEGKDTVPLRWEVEPHTNWNAYYAYHERIQEGLTLFGQHYQSLWD